VHGMIPAGGAHDEAQRPPPLAPVSWPEFANCTLSPEPARPWGYARLVGRSGGCAGGLHGALPGCRCSPMPGSQGKYTGLLALIRAWHRSAARAAPPHLPDPHQRPWQPNPAKRRDGWLKVVAGGLAMPTQQSTWRPEPRAQIHAASLAPRMVTIPSTHWLFLKPASAKTLRAWCTGMRPGLSRWRQSQCPGGARQPGRFRRDVCHLNLHKTFCIPTAAVVPGSARSE